MKIHLLYAGNPNTYHFTDRELSRLSAKVVYACGCVDCLKKRGRRMRLRGFKVVLEEVGQTLQDEQRGRLDETVIPDRQFKVGDRTVDFLSCSNIATFEDHPPAGRDGTP